jgi:hypothetical protein
MAKIAGDHVNVIIDNATGTTKVVTTGGQTLEITQTTDTHDVSGFGEGVHNFVPGQDVQGITLSGPADFAADAVCDVLKDLSGVAGTVTVEIGQNAAPTTGDPTFSGEFLCSQFNVSLSTGAAVTYNAAWVKSNATAAVWGTKT